MESRYSRQSRRKLSVANERPWLSTMAAPFPNLYTLRKVAESAAKGCDVCYKPSSSVLITPDKKVYPGHAQSPFLAQG